MTRALVSQVEKDDNRTFDKDHVPMPWIMRHGSLLFMRLQFRGDGRSIFQAANSELLPFAGCRVGTGGKFSDKRDVLISVRVVCTRSVRRRPGIEQHEKGILRPAKGLSWAARGALFLFGVFRRHRRLCFGIGRPTREQDAHIGK